MMFQELAQRALEVRQLYAAYEQDLYGRSWTQEDNAMGFVGDVGDLMKLVLAQKGIRAIPDAEAKLGHELADCLWSVMVLAHHYNIDLERVFLQTMDGLELHLQQRRNPQPSPSAEP